MKPINQSRMAIAVAGIVLLALAAGAGHWLARSNQAGTSSAATSQATATDDRKILYWYDPMAPEQHFDKPGKSPFMDMALVPKYADETSSAGVRIDPGIRQNLGIRSAQVEVGQLTGEIRVPGTLNWDLRNEVVVSVPVQGIVLRLVVRAPYERVSAGSPLATVLAPEWGTALAEARALARADSAYARGLQRASSQRLRMIGLTSATAAGSGAVILRAPRKGVVREILVREGETAMPGTPLFRINDTTTLWLEAALPQATQGVAPGTSVTATVDAIPGRIFEGRVETLLPDIDETTRTRRARIVLRNEENVLAPGMFAQVRLQPTAMAKVPLVPTEALIAMGEDTRVVVVQPDGSYLPVRVQAGRSAGGRTEIVSGLHGGERVVTSGQFLIDSEASLSGALERLATPKDKAPAGNNHAGHDMPMPPEPAK
jgi:Cu(I)/Ag(I) efflux system membrane fusion protein